MTQTQTLTFSGISSDPSSVIQLTAYHEDASSMVTDTKNVLAANAVRIRFLAAPINPQDLMVIAGRYPVKPVHHDPTNNQPIPGNDGVGCVEAIGSAVTNHSIGDLVIPKRHGLGTWRTHATLPADDLLGIPSRVDPIAAALLKMSFCPAYLLLEDVRKLHPGDWIVLNAAHGAIGQMVAQFARLRGCHTLAVVRTLADDQTQSLHHHDAVVTESELAAQGAAVQPQIEAAAESGRFVLALDAVFGESGARIAQLLAKGATFVNYGSLGGANGIIPLTQDLIFWKQITFRNFRLSEALGSRSVPQQEHLLAWFAELLVNGQLQAPVVERVEWNRDNKDLVGVARKALQSAGAERPVGTLKQVFVFT